MFSGKTDMFSDFLGGNANMELDFGKPLLALEDTRGDAIHNSNLYV